MRPIKLQMTAFGPYVKPIELDFESGLHDEKIFLIHGETGAGKTTILDAISYALYGKTSGAARDAKDMRSKGAPDDVPTEIEFKFALGKKIYTAQREITYHPKRQGNKFQTKVALSCDGHVLETRDNAVKNRITELLGFDAEQFRQVVLLPQGEFKKFLDSDSDKRQEVLNVLFDSAPYQEIENALGERAKISAAQVESLKTRLETLNKQIADAGTDSPAELEAKLSAAQKNLVAFKKILDAAQVQLTDGKNLSRQFSELQRTTDELNGARIRLDSAEKKLSAAEIEYTRREGEQVQRKNFEQQIGDLKKIHATLGDLKHKVDALTSEQKKLQAATATFIDCDQKAKRYEARLEVLKSEKAKLSGADVKFEKLNALSQRATKRDALLKEISRLKRTLEMEQKKLAAVVENFTAAQINLTRLQIVNSAAHLATTLEDGKPCPVCGSLEHPAVIAEAIPTAAEIQAAEKNFESLTKEKAQQEKTVNTTAGNLDARENQLKDFADVPDSAEVQKDFNDAKKQSAELADCLQRIEKGERCVEDNRKALAAADENKNNATVAVAKLESAISEVKRNIPEKYRHDDGKLVADLVAAQKNFDELDKAWKLAQKNFNAAKEMRSACRATVDSLQKNFDRLQSDLKDKTPPDVPELERKVAAANENYGAARDEKAKLEVILDTLKKFSAERDDVEQQLAAKEKIADTWRRLSDVANATGRGDAALKISFQRYYLSTMFDEVVAEANNRLKKMSGGRYLFHMKDEGKTKAKSAGLNLEIFDEYTGALRPVETLSGGESFLASLSLALGLASVVQNNSGGIKLDTIFIDEGFGSLDSNTLDDAISTIIEQSGGRLVGIISHVEELKNQIPVRLEISKGKTGSTAKFIS